MDGRIQLPVNDFLQKRFGAEYVDTITEAGPNLILFEQKEEVIIEAILLRLHISINIHKSVGVAVVGHYDCAKNPLGKDEQTAHTKKAIEFVKKHYNNIEVIGMWVNENWEVVELS